MAVATAAPEGRKTPPVLGWKIIIKEHTIIMSKGKERKKERRKEEKHETKPIPVLGI